MLADELDARYGYLAKMQADARESRQAHALIRLRDARMLKNRTAEMTIQLVRFAREDGATWGDIGRSLGVSRQAARQRFARHMPEPTAGRTAVLMGGTTRWID